jgi:EAL domain-containing protein (putative c-di-GMP-specific phosphodiesterase class I)/ActR/RegA family two-component response regulator
MSAMTQGGTGVQRQRDCILIVDDDHSITESLAFVLSDHGRRIILCSDTEAADLVLDHFDVTHAVTDMQFTGAFGFEGLQFLNRVRDKRPACRIAVMTGAPSDPLRAEALAHGATALLSKPFDSATLERVLELGRPQSDDAAGEILRVPTIDEIVSGNELTTLFQPIVNIGGAEPRIVGFEGLARLRGGWPIGTVAEMFDYGERCHRLAELNVVCMRRALANARKLPAGSTIFINLDPLTFARPGLAELISKEADRAGVELSRLVLEITERDAFPREAAAERTLETLRAAGVRFALDDVGSAYSHFEVIERINPSFMKISQSFGSAFELDSIKQRIVANVLHLARNFDCDVVVEGIESAETAAAAAAMGVNHAQGYFFGRPAAAEEWDTPS